MFVIVGQFSCGTLGRTKVGPIGNDSGLRPKQNIEACLRPDAGEDAHPISLPKEIYEMH